MELTGHVEALRNDLVAAAGAGDETVAAAAVRLSHALRSSLALRLLEVLSEASLELSGQLPGGHVEVRLAGHDPTLVYVAEEPAPAAPAAEEGMAARISLRLPETLKEAVERAATLEGVSVNTWIVRALARMVSSPPPFGPGPGHGPGRRLTGYAKS